MSRETTLAAFFFFQEYKDKDPNEEIPPEILASYTERGRKFWLGINAVCFDLDLVFWEANSKNAVASLEDSELQSVFYEGAKTYYGESNDQIRSFFKDIYLLLWNNDSGVRMGSFVKLYGIREFISLINDKLVNPFGLKKT